MRIKLDEDLSQSVGKPLQVHGYEVLTVYGQGWSGLKDPDLWPLVVTEGVFFVTLDKRFGDIRAYPPGTHPGILLLRPDHDSILECIALLENVLAKHQLQDLIGCIIVVTARSIRIRRPAA